jgi:hypothetical protein
MPKRLQIAAWIQGAYYLVSGCWALVDISSFQAVTGPKQDLWLVKTVGLLLVVCAAALLSAAYRKDIRLESVLIGGGAALSLAAIDVIYVFRGVISTVYLLDAAVEVAFGAFWARHIRFSNSSANSIYSKGDTCSDKSAI